jgi:hypothetical protein
MAVFQRQDGDKEHQKGIRCLAPFYPEGQQVLPVFYYTRIRNDKQAQCNTRLPCCKSDTSVFVYKTASYDVGDSLQFPENLVPRMMPYDASESSKDSSTYIISHFSLGTIQKTGDNRKARGDCCNIFIFRATRTQRMTAISKKASQFTQPFCQRYPSSA